MTRRCALLCRGGRSTTSSRARAIMASCRPARRALLIALHESAPIRRASTALRFIGPSMRRLCGSSRQRFTRVDLTTALPVGAFEPTGSTLVDCRLALLGLRQSMVTVFFGNRSYRSVGDGQRKIDRSMPIVAEAIQITDRRNSCLKSRARISDGSPRRFFTMRRRNLR
jgi:hypothetical protein